MKKNVFLFVAVFMFCKTFACSIETCNDYLCSDIYEKCQQSNDAVIEGKAKRKVDAQIQHVSSIIKLTEEEKRILQEVWVNQRKELLIKSAEISDEKKNLQARKEINRKYGKLLEERIGKKRANEINKALKTKK